MDLTNLEDALNNGNFKEQVYCSLESIYQISNVLNQLDLLKNFSEHDLEIVGKIQAIKSVLEDYETREQELKAKINALADNLEAKKQELEAKKQELEARLNMELQSALSSEIQKLNDTINALETQLIELAISNIYNESVGEMILCLKANSKAYPIANTFYRNKTMSIFNNHKIIDCYKVNCIFKTPSEEADYKIAFFARKHKGLWVNVNYTSKTEGFETSFLNDASFRNLTTQSIPTDYNNNQVFYKRSQAIVYEILQ